MDDGNRGPARRVSLPLASQQRPANYSGSSWNFASRRCRGEFDMIKKVVGDVTEGVSSLTEKVTPIAEKVLDTGKATVEETKSLASAVLEGDGADINKEVSDIAQKVMEGAEATIEETKRLAASVLGKE
jgi:hypothetical protein